MWRDETKWKYYKNSQNTKRATKNFNNPQDAYNHMAKVGNGEGVVIEVKGKVKACNYCKCRPICSQANMLEESGEL